MIENYFIRIQQEIVKRIFSYNRESDIEKLTPDNFLKSFSLPNISIDIPRVEIKNHEMGNMNFPSGITYTPGMPIKFYEVIIPIKGGFESSAVSKLQNSPFEYNSNIRAYYSRYYPKNHPANLEEIELTNEFNKKIKEDYNTLKSEIDGINKKINDINHQISNFLSQQIDLRKEEFKKEKELKKRINPFL